MRHVRRFNTFLVDHVNLSQRRIDQLDDRVAAVSNFLQGGEDDIATRFVDTIPQGSYAQQTIINPVDKNDEFDGDILLELTDDGGDWEAEEYVQKLYEKFRSSSTYRGMVRRRARCVTVDYANEFHIDVVPYLERHGQHYITNRDDNEYELTDPTGFNTWLDGQNRIASGNLVKVLRLLKYLRDHKNNYSIKSVVLTILVGGRISSTLLLEDEKHYRDVPTTLKNVLAALNEYLQANPTMPSIEDPSGTGETFNHRWDQDQYANFRKWVTYYSDKVAAAYAEENQAESIKKWQEVFGTEFGPLEAVKKASSTPVASARLTQTEEDLEEDKGIRVALDRRYTVRIQGRVLGKGKGFNPYNLADRGNRVSPQRKIDFRYTTNCTGDFQVYWKVRNFGEEAIEADCIRGQILADDGTGVRHEPTAYKGKHYVEVYIVKGGVCVARDRQTVIIR